MSDSNSPVHMKHSKMVYTLKISCNRLYSILDEVGNTCYTYTKISVKVIILKWYNDEDKPNYINLND